MKIVFPAFAKRSDVIAVATFVAALVLRLIFAQEWHGLPYGDAPLLDAKSYHLWAQEIAGGRWMRGTAFYQSPLYPYALAALYSLFGPSAAAASVFNALLDAGTCALLSLIAFRCFGASAGALTGLLAAFYRPMIFFTAPIMKETLGLFLLALFLSLALKALGSGKWRDYFFSGIALGLAVLTRGNFLFVGFAFVVFLFLRERRGALRHGALFLGALVLAILPATLHNALASRDFVPITYNSGFNFYIGNSPYTEGATTYPPGISSDPLVGEEHDMRAIAERDMGRPLLPSEASDYWMRLGFKALAQNAKGVFVLFANKLWLFWDASEHSDNYDMTFIARNFDTVLSWPLITFGIIAAAAVFTAVAFGRKKKESFFLVSMVFATMLSVILFYVTDRYRLPVVVFLLPLAGGIFAALGNLFEEQRIKRFAAALAVAAFFVLIGHKLVTGNAVSEANNWGFLAHIESDAGKDVEALALLEKGLAIAPHKVRGEALRAGALSAKRLGRDEAAERLIGLAPP